MLLILNTLLKSRVSWDLPLPWDLSKINLSSILQSHSLWKSKALPMDSRVSRSQDHPSLLGSCDLTCRLCSELPQPRHKTELIPHLPKKKKKSAHVRVCVCFPQRFWEQRSPCLFQFTTDTGCSPQACGYSSPAPVCWGSSSHPS